MNLISLLYLFSGFISTLPVIICRQFYSLNNFNIQHIIIFIFIIYFVWTIISLLLYYYIYKNIKIGQFYIIIKLLEIGITILTSIFIYKEKYNIFKYIGFFFAFISLILVSI